MGLLGWKWDPLVIGVRGEWIHARDPDRILAAGSRSNYQVAPSLFVIGDGDVYGGSVFVTWAVTGGVFVRAEYRLDAADYDIVGAPTTGILVNPDTAKAHLALIQVNASFE